MNKTINAVFDGGGVKGIGLVGAVSATEERGYSFNMVAGTSAGAIVAAFLASGYTSSEMKQILDTLNYNDFKDKGNEDKIPGVGFLLSLWFQNGIYEGDYFENWLRTKLLSKGISTFKDLLISKNKYRLQVTATDISRHKLLVLPHDIVDYGINPDDLDVALAVRMSMSIPLFFEPITLHQNKGKISYIVDGGVLSNYPIWIFDGEETPTLGYKLIEKTKDENRTNTINNPVNLLIEMFTTMMDAHDARYIEDKNFIRTIPIDTLGVSTIDFNMTKEKKDELYLSGRTAAEKFFSWWDINDYNKQKFISRSERLLKTVG